MAELSNRVMIKADDGYPFSVDPVFELDHEQRRRPALVVDHDAEPCVRILDPVGIVDVVLGHADHRRPRRANPCDLIILVLRLGVYILVSGRVRAWAVEGRHSHSLPQPSPPRGAGGQAG